MFSRKLPRWLLAVIAIAPQFACRSHQTKGASPKPLVLMLTDRGLDWNDACRAGRIVCRNKTPTMFSVASEGVGTAEQCGCSVSLEPFGMLSFGASGGRQAAFTLWLTAHFSASDFGSNGTRMIGAAQELNRRVFGQPVPEKLRRVLVDGGSEQTTTDGLKIAAKCDKGEGEATMQYRIEMFRRVPPTSSVRPNARQPISSRSRRP